MTARSRSTAGGPAALHQRRGAARAPRPASGDAPGVARRPRGARPDPVAMSKGDSIAEPVDRVVDGALDGLARFAADRVGDFHARGRPDLGHLGVTVTSPGPRCPYKAEISCEAVDGNGRDTNPTSAWRITTPRIALESYRHLFTNEAAMAEFASILERATQEDDRPLVTFQDRHIATALSPRRPSGSWSDRILRRSEERR